MSKVYQKLDLTANILTIIVTVLILGALASKFLYTKPNSSPQKPSPTLGSKILLTNVEWSKHSKNVLLVLQKGCRFCTESANFYKNLIAQTNDKNIRVLAVLPQNKEEAQAYLNSLGIDGIEVIQSQLNSLNVGGTPTVIVVNGTGEVSKFWVGKLPPETEQEVINYLTL